jgi:hypothetical protein
MTFSMIESQHGRRTPCTRAIDSRFLERQAEGAL